MDKGKDKELLKYVLKFDKKITAIYEQAIDEVAKIGGSIDSLSPEKLFSFSDYPKTSKRINKLLSSMANNLFNAIKTGAEGSWELSEAKNNELAKWVKIDSPFVGVRLKEAKKAFFERRMGKDGLNLSQRVWNYTEQFKQEMELALDIGIGEGRTAPELSRDIRQYLKEPNRLFHRVRNKHGNLVLSKAAKAYHPGQGVYRSSYKNALRTSRTEINISYRKADGERWRAEPFVIGVKIALSNNHPRKDICDILAGEYPCEFEFTGWHPQCFCHAKPIIAPAKELKEMRRKILAGEDISQYKSKNEIKEPPASFTTWVKSNAGLIANASEKGKIPYFLRDNKKYVDEILHPLSPEQKYQKKLIEKYGKEAFESLYKALDYHKAKVLSKDSISDKKSYLEFEISWANNHPKYETTPELVKLLQKELDSLVKEAEKDEILQKVYSIKAYSSTSKSAKIKALASDLDLAMSGNMDMVGLKSLIANAEKAIEKQKASNEYHKLRSARIRAGKAPKKPESELSIRSVFTQNELIEIHSLEAELDAALKVNDMGKVSSISKVLSDKLKKLGIKYAQKNPAIPHLNSLSKAEYDKAYEYLKNQGIVSGEYRSITGYEYLDKVELSCLRQYTGSYYSSLNDFLRGELPGSKRADEYRYFEAVCNRAIENAPRFEGTTWRGAYLDDSIISEIKNGMSSGVDWIHKGFCSSSRIKGANFSGNVLFKIKCKAGALVEDISHVHGELEVLLRSGTKFKIVSMTERSVGNWFIELEEML